MNLTPLIGTGWWMSLGERAALEGLLSTIRPALSIEIGTARGGSLARLAKHSQQVHSIDFDPRVVDPPPNVIFHRGDSRVLLPELLARFESEGKTLDFA